MDVVESPLDSVKQYTKSSAEGKEKMRGRGIQKRGEVINSSGEQERAGEPII